MEGLIENTIWTEKYRPKTLDEMILSPETMDMVTKFKQEHSIPNLFLCSRPGQGKTTFAKALVNYFGCDKLYLNCSDENNVDTVRNKVSNFSRTLSTNGSFKIVILDEADGFANVQAQKILRGLMEEVHDTTRFVITANYKNKIIEALRSRCQEIDINPPKKLVVKRVIEILQKEGVVLEKDDYDSLKNLINRFFPDVRSIIKNLQSSVFDGKLKIKDFKLNSELSGEILDFIFNKDFIGLRKHIINNSAVFNEDYSLLLDDFYHLIIDSDSVDATLKAEWTVKLAEYLYKSENAIDQELNTIACFYSMALALPS